MVVVVLYFSLTQIKEPALEPGLIVFTLVGKGQKHSRKEKKILMDEFRGQRRKQVSLR